MSIAPGMCSITLRSLDADEVVAIAARAGIEGIEWGADRHAPPGDTRLLERLATRCHDAGVEVVSYGSYLGFGPVETDEGPEVTAVLDATEALGAPMVRIWAELGVTPDAPPADRQRVVARTAAHVDAIVSRGLTPVLEFHPNTLTETAASANELLDDLGSTDVRTHWQPDPSLSPDAAVDELALIAPHLAHLHVFSWGPGGIGDRRPLAEGADLWPRALALATSEGAPMARRRYALCEYVRGDDTEQLLADVATLHAWLADLAADPRLA